MFVNEKFKYDYMRYKKKEWSLIAFCGELIKSKRLRYIFFGRSQNKLMLIISSVIGNSMGNEIDFSQINRGLILGHPYNITVGTGSIIGENATLFKGVTIGAIRGGKQRRKSYYR